MNSNSIFAPDLRLVLVHARLYERLAETAVERQRSRAARQRPNRIAAAIRTLRQAVTTVADSTTSTLPRLEGYPYRS